MFTVYAIYDEFANILTKGTSEIEKPLVSSLEASEDLWVEVVLGCCRREKLSLAYAWVWVDGPGFVPLYDTLSSAVPFIWRGR